MCLLLYPSSKENPKILKELKQLKCKRNSRNIVCCQEYNLYFCTYCTFSTYFSYIYIYAILPSVFALKPLWMEWHTHTHTHRRGRGKLTAIFFSFLCHSFSPSLIHTEVLVTKQLQRNADYIFAKRGNDETVNETLLKNTPFFLDREK